MYKFIIPPIVGAAIGYTTNYLAVKMLFHPKKAYYIANMRIPFTPGLIPKKRKELTESIATLVSQQLINEKDIIRNIYTQKNRETLYRLGEDFFHKLKEKPLNTFLHIDKDWLKEKINAQLIKKELYLFLYDRISSIIDDVFFSKKQICDLLPHDFRINIRQFSDTFTDSILESLRKSLKKENTRQAVSKYATEIIYDYAQSSNVIIKTIVNMATPLIEDSDKFADAILKGADTILDSEVIRKNSRDAVFSKIEELMKKEISETYSLLNYKSKQEMREAVKKHIFLIIKNDKNVNLFLEQDLPRKLYVYLRLLTQKAKLKDVWEFMGRDATENLSRNTVRSILYFLRTQTGAIIFDIKKIVLKKVSNLDIEGMEDITLKISRDQFKYIEIFGGILGGLIGLTQVILTQFIL